MARTRDLCQDCWQDVHPSCYAYSLVTRYGECVRCGTGGIRLYPSTIADEIPAPISAWPIIAREDDPTTQHEPCIVEGY